MMGIFFSLLYFGGCIPAYRHARNHEHNILHSFLDAVSWPFDVGWNLAEKHCSTEKE